MSLVVDSQNTIVLANTATRVNMSIRDVDGALVDPYSILLTVMDIGGTVKFTASWPVMAPTTTRIIRSSIGQFYIVFGNQEINTETDVAVEWLFNWSVQVTDTSDTSNTIQKVKVISPKSASLIPEFRLMIDKTRKLIDATNECFLGYADDQLISYLEGGLGTINAYQPSVSFTMDTFPLEFKQILLDAGLIVGVMSQQLFAIDTDIPNYNDQGTSFVISHQPQLASVLNQVTQRLDKLIPMMKLQLINSGCVHVQMGPSFRLTQLVESAPSGSLFRNVYFRG